MAENLAALTPPDPDGPRPVASIDNTGRTAMRLAETVHPAADGLLRTSRLLYDSRMTEEGPRMGREHGPPGRVVSDWSRADASGSDCQALPALTVLVVALGINGVIARGLRPGCRAPGKLGCAPPATRLELALRRRGSPSSAELPPTVPILSGVGGRA
jgi:hypothetical protein